MSYEEFLDKYKGRVIEASAASCPAGYGAIYSADILQDLSTVDLSHISPEIKIYEKLQTESPADECLPGYTLVNGLCVKSSISWAEFVASFTEKYGDRIKFGMSGSIPAGYMYVYSEDIKTDIARLTTGEITDAPFSVDIYEKSPYLPPVIDPLEEFRAKYGDRVVATSAETGAVCPTGYGDVYSEDIKLDLEQVRTLLLPGQLVMVCEKLPIVKSMSMFTKVGIGAAVFGGLAIVWGMIKPKKR